jgi:uncharacterized protein (DUF1800 family)
MSFLRQSRLILPCLLSVIFLVTAQAQSQSPTVPNQEIQVQNSQSGISKYLQQDPSHINAFLNRITWGINASTIEQSKNGGIDNYLRQQLQATNSHLPQEIQSQIDAMSISKTPFIELMHELDKKREAYSKTDKTDNSLRKEYQQELNRIYTEGASRSLLRSIYSTNQLYEQMTWFWMNHFNISNRKGNTRAMLPDFEEHAIRPYALGNFRDLLRATILHPAMLRYLDNEHNAVGKINENYARELMELHTMGVDSGYTQNDVQELARVLTGLGVNFKPAKKIVRRKGMTGFGNGNLYYGLTEFNAKQHDFGDKVILGHQIKGQGVAEIDQVIALLTRHPATAHFISKKLATYFVSDEPSKELVNQMAAQFLKTDGDIPSILQVMFDSPEFINSIENKFKDPMHYVVSSLRIAYDGEAINNTRPILNWINTLGQEANGHQTPDGYSMKESVWSSPAQMTARFDIAKIIARGSANLFMDDDATKMRRKDVPQPQLFDTIFTRNLSQYFGKKTQEILNQTKNSQEWNVLFLASPEMMRR